MELPPLRSSWNLEPKATPLQSQGCLLEVDALQCQQHRKLWRRHRREGPHPTKLHRCHLLQRLQRSTRRKVPDEVEPKQEDDQTWWQASWPQDARDWSWQRSWSQWGPPVTSGNPRGHGYYHGNVYVDSWGVARPQLGLRFEQTSVWRPRIGAGRQRARTRGGRHIREHQNLIEAVTTMAATMNSLTGRR